MTLVKTVDERSAMLKEVVALTDTANAVQNEIDGIETCLARVVRPTDRRGEGECSVPKRQPETIEEALADLRRNLHSAHQRMADLRHRLQLG